MCLWLDTTWFTREYTPAMAHTAHDDIMLLLMTQIPNAVFPFSFSAHQVVTTTSVNTITNFPLLCPPISKCSRNMATMTPRKPPSFSSVKLNIKLKKVANNTKGRPTWCQCYLLGPRTRWLHLHSLCGATVFGLHQLYLCVWRLATKHAECRTYKVWIKSLVPF